MIFPTRVPDGLFSSTVLFERLKLTGASLTGLIVIFTSAVPEPVPISTE